MPVYCIQVGENGPLKVGHATDPYKRLKNLQIGSVQPLRLLGTKDGAEAEERQIHERFSHLRIRGEWFAYSDEMAGCFDPSEANTAASARRRRRSSLDAFLEDRGIKRIDFAKRLGISASLLTGLCQGLNWPGRNTALAIARETGGQVTCNDFLRAPEPQAAD